MEQQYIYTKFRVLADSEAIKAWALTRHNQALWAEVTRGDHTESWVTVHDIAYPEIYATDQRSELLALWPQSLEQVQAEE